MNKAKLDRRIQLAYESIRECELLKDNVLDHAFQAQIASFGAAVRNGSLKAAIAFFSRQGGAAVDRSKLLQCIGYILAKEQEKADAPEGKTEFLEVLYEQVRSGTTKQEILDAAVALKLAMNLYPMEDEKHDSGEIKPD